MTGGHVPTEVIWVQRERRSLDGVPRSAAVSSAKTFRISEDGHSGEMEFVGDDILRRVRILLDLEISHPEVTWMLKNRKINSLSTENYTSLHICLHILTCFVLSCLVSSRLVSSRLVSSCLALSCLVLSCRVVSHLVSSHLISARLASS